MLSTNDYITGDIRYNRNLRIVLPLIFSNLAYSVCASANMRSLPLVHFYRKRAVDRYKLCLHANATLRLALLLIFIAPSENNTRIISLLRQTKKHERAKE